MDVKKKVKIVIRLGTGNSVIQTEVIAYKTKIAGIVVHREIKHDEVKNKTVALNGSWNITQYPTGLKAFGGIPTKNHAIDIAENYMAGFNWVGLNVDDVMAPNDSKAIQEMAKKVNTVISGLQMSRKR